MKLFFSAFWILAALQSLPQQVVKGKVISNNEPVEGVTIQVKGLKQAVRSGKAGIFTLTLQPGDYTLSASSIGYRPIQKQINIADKDVELLIELQEMGGELAEMVITGTMSEISKSASAVPVEVYTPKFFQKASPANLFEAVSLVNGAKP